MQKTEPKYYVGKTVKVIVDRPLGSTHPDWPTHVYTVNYGYVPETLSGDGEELDVYILGVDEPIIEFQGECIAYIIREDDPGDDKLIVVPPGHSYSDQEIQEMVHFQEQYFKSQIRR